jgi:hypothetical protein
MGEKCIRFSYLYTNTHTSSSSAWQPFVSPGLPQNTYTPYYNCHNVVNICQIF